MANPQLNLLKEKIPGYTPKNCLDIGANRGQFAHEILRNYPGCKILSFEPLPACEPNLKQFPIEYRMYGLSDEKKVLKFYTTSATSKGATAYPETNVHPDAYKSFKVKMYRLDDVVEGKWDLIKVDVQGAELDVINGGVETVKKADYVILETPIVDFNMGAPNAEQVVKRMEELGFYIYDLLMVHKTKRDVREVQLDLIFHKSDKHNLTNLEKYKTILGF